MTARSCKASSILRHPVFDTPVFWNNTALLRDLTGLPMQAFALRSEPQQINTTPISVSSMTLAYPGSSPTLSSNSSNGRAVVAGGSGNPGDPPGVRRRPTSPTSSMTPRCRRTAIVWGAEFALPAPTVANGQGFRGRTRASWTFTGYFHRRSSAFPDEVECYRVQNPWQTIPAVELKLNVSSK